MKELYLADCLDLLKNWYENGIKEFIDLIYIDPPFNSNRNYNIIFKGSEATEHAFKDTWSGVSYLDEIDNISNISPNIYNFLKMLIKINLPESYVSYLTHLSIRCWYMRQMLKSTGSFYLHCDPTSSHYVKMILDNIFGIDNYLNELIWCYDGPSSPKMKVFAKKHDVIFRYSKTKDFVWNVEDIREQYTETSLKAFKSPSKIGGLREKYISRGKHPTDWLKIPSLKNTRERLGYPTQKPMQLIRKIILASSNENDLVADFFMGGGTTIAVAEELNRQWIGTDINYRALNITTERLKEAYNLTIKKDFVIHGIPKTASELKQMVDDNILGSDKNSKFAFEDVIIKYYLKGVIGNSIKIGDNSIDGRFTFNYKGQIKNGLVQVTTSSNINHLKAFCSEIGKGNGDLGVYITFENKVTHGMIKEVKEYGKIGNVDKIQILTVEDLIDRGKHFEVPQEILTF